MPEITNLRLHLSRFKVEFFQARVIRGDRADVQTWMVYDAAHVGTSPGQYTSPPCVGQFPSLQEAVSWCDHIVAEETPTIPHEAWNTAKIPGTPTKAIWI